MANYKHLIYAFLKFLDDQQRSPDLTPDAIESLEVASQCLESAYGVTIRDVDAAALYPLPGSLQEIFACGLNHLSFPAASVSDKEQAEKLKAEGNEMMKKDQYLPAIDCYTKAIQLDGRNAVYFCNRAAAYGKLGEHVKSIEDCRKALELDSKYSKAFGRMGLAHIALGQHREAKDCFQRALQLDPTNDTYRDNLRQCEQLMREENGVGAVPGAMGGLNLSGFDVSSLLSNPALMNMATSMLSNPQMQQMMASMMAGASGPAGGGGAPANISSLLQAGQQLAQQMQQANPELVEQLRSQMRMQPPSSTPPPGNPPDGSQGSS